MSSSARVYVDKSVISLITELRAGAPSVSQVEVDGLDLLCDDDALEFVTSEQTLEEFKRAAGRLRVALKLLYRLIGLSTVPMQPTQVPNPQIIVPAGRSRAVMPPTRPDDLYAALCAIFSDDDAQHLFNPVLRGGCDYFLTLDVKTIVKPAELHQEHLAALCGRIEFGLLYCLRLKARARSSAAQQPASPSTPRPGVRAPRG